MGAPRGRRIAWATTLLGLAVLAGAGVAFKDRAFERWYLYKLDSEVEAEREEAARWLGAHRSVKAVPRLMEVFFKGNEFSPGVSVMVNQPARRLYALEALCKVGPEGTDSLVERLKADRFWFGFRLPLETLEPLGPEAAPLVIETLNHSYEAAIEVLVRLGPKAVPHLLRALRRKEKTPAIQVGALKALGGIGPEAKDAVPELSAIYEDRKEKPFIRGDAEEALEKIQNRPPPEPQLELWLLEAAAAPGEEARVALVGSPRVPLSYFAVRFRPPAVVESIRSEPAGTASAHAHPRGTVYAAVAAAPGAWAGVDLRAEDLYQPIEPGDDILLLKIVLRLRPDAEPGEHAFEVDAVQAAGLSRDLTAAVRGAGLLRVTAR